MDATIMTCDILRRNHRLVEAELLCRRALSRGHTETVLRAMSNLLLDQIVSHLVSYRSYDHTHTHTHTYVHDSNTGEERSCGVMESSRHG